MNGQHSGGQGSKVGVVTNAGVKRGVAGLHFTHAQSGLIGREMWAWTWNASLQGDKLLTTCCDIERRKLHGETLSSTRCPDGKFLY